MDKHNSKQTTMTRRGLFRTAGAAALGGLAFSLGQHVRSFAHEGDEGVLEIHLGEFYFQAHDAEKNAPIRLKAGEAHLIRFMNEGQVEHEIHFGRDANVAEAHYMENLFGPGGDEAMRGWLGLHLKPGEAATIHVFIPESKKGEWEIGCFMPGHYEAGQKAPLIIE